MEIILRGIRFLRRYVFTDIKYTIAYLLIFWQRGFVFSTRLLSEKELVEELKKGKSLIRLGDGEINLMRGQKNHYQNFSPFLQKAMFDIVKQYTHESPYILAVPRFITCTNKELESMGKLYVWLPLKATFWIYFNKIAPYLDAHSFYYDGYFERTVGMLLGDKQVVLITKQETIDKQRNNKNIPWGKVSYVVTPEDEALSTYLEIKERIDSTIAAFDQRETVLLFAMGPVGKLLALEYARQGIQSIDVGKVAEVFYTGESIAYII